MSLFSRRSFAFAVSHGFIFLYMRLVVRKVSKDRILVCDLGLAKAQAFDSRRGLWWIAHASFMPLYLGI